MEQEERDARNSVMAGWVLRLVETYHGPHIVVLRPEVHSALTRMAAGASWASVSRRLGGEAWMLADECGRAALFGATQQYRVPSLVAPMLVEFRDWWFEETARLRWEVMGIGAEDAEFLAGLGSPFKEAVQD